jgi:hypothetical protein
MVQPEHLVLPDQEENMDSEDQQEHSVKTKYTEWTENPVHQDPKDQ